MDLNNIILGALNLVMLAAGTILWANFKETKQMSQESLNKLSEYKIYCAEKFITGDELKDALRELNTTLERNANRVDATVERILTKLDSKQDK